MTDDRGQRRKKGADSLNKDGTFWELEHSLGMLWERFLTVIHSVGSTSIFMVGNHSHQALASTGI
jgi:hypothetical protein